MPYDNNHRAQVNRASANPPTVARTKQGPYIAPRLAKLATNVPPTVPSEEGTPPPLARTAAQSNHVDAHATPVKAVLSPNVTPRSSSRKTRVRSLSTTPNGSPNETAASPRPKSMVAPVAVPPQNSRGTVKPGPTARPHTRNGSMSSAVSASSMRSSLASPRHTRNASGQESSPTFFRADETKSHFASRATPKPTKAQSNESSALVHAYGNRETPTPGLPSRPLRPRLAQGQTSAERILPRVQNAPLPPRLPHSSPPSTISRVETSAQSRSRPTSPLKESILQRRSTNSQELQQAPKPILPAVSSPHRKLSSSSGSGLAAVDSESSRSPKTSCPLDGRLRSSTSDAGPQNNSSTTISSKPSSPGQDSGLTCPSAKSDAAVSPTFKSQKSPLTSPLRFAPLGTTADNPADRQKTLAADARRERKVLDLEISNSSLLAINRTLEREMRKQNAELRRYRRLTSAGRISLAARSKRSISSGFSTGSGLDDLSEFTEDSEEDESSDRSASDEEADLDRSGDPLGDDQDRSSSALAVRRAQQRAKDEARLQADLQKHHELLADSQRMNQSIKRCLGWTEDLLEAGRKALAVRVHPGDVQLSGRVLVGEEADLEQTQRRALLSPPLGKTELDFGDAEVAEAEVQQAEAMDAIVGSLKELHLSVGQPSDAL